jgi:hypothetical protein
LKANTMTECHGADHAKAFGSLSIKFIADDLGKIQAVELAAPGD